MDSHLSLFWLSFMQAQKEDKKLNKRIKRLEKQVKRKSRNV